MENTRASIFDEADLSQFTPKKERTPRQNPSVVKEAAQESGFKSREAKAIPAETQAPAQRRRRTGRNAQFNIKAKPETIQAFIGIADANGWGLGETLEKAVELLELSRGK
jgi:hypothetical protein